MYSVHCLHHSLIAGHYARQILLLEFLDFEIFKFDFEFLVIDFDFEVQFMIRHAASLNVILYYYIYKRGEDKQRKQKNKMLHF